MTRRALLEEIAGKEVLFITPSDIDYIRNRQEIKILREAAKGLNIIAPRHTPVVSPTGIKRIFHTNLKAILAGIRGNGKYDVVFIGGIPQLILPFTSIFFKKKTIVVDFFISLYDTLVCDRQVLSATNPLSRLLKMLDRYTLSRADCVVVDTREHAAYFSEMFGIDVGKMRVIYLEADRDIYYSRDVGRPPNLNDKFIAFFFGAMNPLQGVEVILEAARIIENHEDIIFIMVGPCEKINTWNRYTKLKNLRLVARWLPQSEIANYIAMADVCLAGHFSATVKKASRVIPGKAYSYLAMDKPVILGDNPANRELFSEETGNAHFVKMGNSEALASEILRMANERERGLSNA